MFRGKKKGKQYHSKLQQTTEKHSFTPQAQQIYKNRQDAIFHAVYARQAAILFSQVLSTPFSALTRGNHQPPDLNSNNNEGSAAPGSPRRCAAASPESRRPRLRRALRGAGAERGRPGPAGQCRSPLLGVQLPLQPPPPDESHGAARPRRRCCRHSRPGRARPRLREAGRAAGRGRSRAGSPARPVRSAGEAGEGGTGKRPGKRSRSAPRVLRPRPGCGFSALRGLRGAHGEKLTLYYMVKQLNYVD